MTQSLEIKVVPSKLPRLMVYLTPETKADLERLATYERRSLSQAAVFAIEEAIRRAKAEGKIPSNSDAQ
ncbi:hypothetical protein H6F69_31035 [Leptolyngbya sp. FACHB-1624]|nr:hypothetical protein [Leptolyngbya sp. FACHB-1624]